jgi:hypothetical protein
MRTVTNQSLQSFQVFFSTPSGVQSYRIKPKKSIVVPESYLTDQVKTMAKRKLLKITNA